MFLGSPVSARAIAVMWVSVRDDGGPSSPSSMWIQQKKPGSSKGNFDEVLWPPEGLLGGSVLTKRKAGPRWKVQGDTQR